MAKVASLDELPSFQIERCDNEARLGLLNFRRRLPIQTPHYIGLASRGCVPHLTQDMMRDETSIKGIYTGLEDYVESLPQPPPLFSFPCPPGDSPLRRFIALQNDSLLVLGPRRNPPSLSPDANTYTSLRICTSVGYRYLEVETYLEAVRKLRPDIVVGIADVESRSSRLAPGQKRKEKMGERTKAWVRALQEGLKQMNSGNESVPALWAPILPIEAEMQREHLDSLEEADSGSIRGLVVYDAQSLLAIPPSLRELPRMSLTDPRTPQEVLTSISLGIDLLTLPFVTTASDAGVAFSFSFPAPQSTTQRLPLGVDLWSTFQARDLSPLQKDCTCYACQKHHRAFIQHLLNAKEMLAWVLLQVHNHHVMDKFFQGVRASIQNGNFEKDVDDFERVYEPNFPDFVGQGPRIRGYQLASAAATTKKKNRAPWSKSLGIDAPRSSEHKPKVVDEGAEKVEESKETTLLDQKTNAMDLEDLGFAKLYE